MTEWLLRCAAHLCTVVLCCSAWCSAYTQSLVATITSRIYAESDSQFCVHGRYVFVAPGEGGGGGCGKEGGPVLVLRPVRGDGNAHEHAHSCLKT